MNTKMLITIFLVLSFNLNLQAETIKNKKPETKELMQQFLKQLTQLKEYFVSEEKFNDQKNHDKIANYLKDFSTLAKQTIHDPVLNQENFKFSRYVLEEHIGDTERVFRLGNKSYARRKIASTISVCMSCHTQMPSDSRSFKNFSDLKSFPSINEKAEFLFATRSFDEASKMFNKIIVNYSKKTTTMQLEDALKRQLVYYSRIKKNPTEAISVFKKYQKNKELPKYLQESLAAWISQFEKWSTQADLDPKSATDKEILSFVQSKIDEKSSMDQVDSTNPNLVSYLRVSGLLFEYLQHHPESKATPEILYWLSICDRSMNNTLFYSLSDLYLRECILKYSDQPIAKKCYKEYEAETIWGYTGTLGTDLPKEVKSDLDYLKEIVESNGKNNIQRH